MYQTVLYGDGCKTRNVPRLLDGIRTDKLDAVKTRIMADTELRSDFDSCVTLYQDFIKQTAAKSKGNPREVNVSEVKVSGGKRKASDEAEDRYYTKAEYDALSPAQKKDLANKRAKRGHKPGSKDSKTNKKEKGKGDSTNKMNKSIKVFNRTVAQLAKQMTKTDIGVADEASAASESSDDTQPKSARYAAGGNRTNASLTRQTSPKKSK